MTRPLAILLLLTTGFAHGAANVVPLPRLPNGPIEMRVAHVVNPRLPRMTAKQLQILLNAAAATVRDHFGVELRFAPVVETPVAELFGKIPAKRRSDAYKDIYDFKSGKGDPAQLGQDFARGFRSSGENLQDMIAYLRPHSGVLKAQTFEALGAAAANLQLERIKRWKNVRALDGKPAIDDAPYNEFLMWMALGYAEVPYELLLTNQIIASIERTFPAVHAAIRGGYSNGLTTYSAHSRYQTFSVWSTYAFDGNEEGLVRLREGEAYNEEEAARLAGIGAAHEIGHQLFHFLHPFGNSACVMNPVSSFTYRAWAAALSPKHCPIGSSPAMKPGAYKFRY